MAQFQTKQSTATKALVFLKDSTGAAKTGVLYSAVTVAYTKAGAAPVVKAIASPDWAELSAANMPGWYTLNFTAAETDTLPVLGFVVSAAGVVQFNDMIEVVAKLASDVDSDVLALNTAAVFGKGPYSWTVKVTDSATPTPNPIASATVLVQLPGTSSIVAIGLTDNTGTVVFAAATGTYDLVIIKPGVGTWPTQASVAISGNRTTTVAGTLYSVPGTPAAAGMCTIFEYLKNQDSTNATGITATARIVSLPANYSGALYSGATVSVVSDSNGYVSWNLPQGALVLFNIANFSTNKKSTVPATTTPTRLSTLA